MEVRIVVRRPSRWHISNSQLVGLGVDTNQCVLRSLVNPDTHRPLTRSDSTLTINQQSQPGWHDPDDGLRYCREDVKECHRLEVLATEVSHLLVKDEHPLLLI